MVYMCLTVSGNEHETQDEPDRWLETDDNSDTDSVAELEYNTWNDACTWEFRSASGNEPPGLIKNPPTDIIQNDDEYLEKFGDGGYVDGGIQSPRFCLGQQHSLWDSGIQNNDNMFIHRLYPKLTSCCHTDDMDFLSPLGVL